MPFSLPLRAFLEHRRLSLRLLLAIGGSSLLLILIAISFQLYTEYRRDLAGIDSRLKFIEDSYVPAIAASAYQLDEELMRLQLRGILQLQDVVHARVLEQLNSQIYDISEGNERKQGVMHREYQLRYQERHSVGVLHVQVSLEGILVRLRERAWTIALSNTLLIVPLAFAIVLILQRAVNRHLVRMAEYARTLQLDNLEKPLTLRRLSGRSGGPDELDQLVAAINEMRLRIRDDVGHRQETERELVFRKTLLECVLEARIDGICILTEDYGCLFCNKVFRQLWQAPEDYLTGASMRPLFADMVEQLRDAKPFAAVLAQIEADPGVTVQGEMELRSGVVLDYFSVPVESGDRTRYGRLWSFRNISGRKELEAQLRQSRKLETLGSLAGGIAHDFNNVLSPIIGYAELVMNQLPAESPLTADLGQVLKAAGRATELTRQILAFSRKQVLEVQLLDVNSLLRDYQAMLQRLIGEAITVKIIRSPQPALIRADRSQIEQVILNLAVNARDAMPDGGVLHMETAVVSLDQHCSERHIEVVPGDYVLLSISDTGTGIDEAIRDRIFDPFFTTKEHGKGTGLGLATAFGIVKQHKGHLWVYSELGYGTTFKIYLPKAEGEPAAKVVESKSPAPRGCGTILVVEDDAMVRGLVCEALASHGYQVVSADHPEAAIEQAEGLASVDLLLTDVVLPKMNGRALHRRLTGLLPDLKVLYMSGYTENVIADQGVLHEGVDFIQKPFSVRALLNKVHSIIG